MAEALWARLQRVLESVAPGVPRGGLNPPATESQVAAVERLVGCRLPEDLREAYRQEAHVATELTIEGVAAFAEETYNETVAAESAAPTVKGATTAD